MNKDLPLGFGMALAQQPDAMKKFSNMTEDEQNRILAEIHNINSKRKCSHLFQGSPISSAGFIFALIYNRYIDFKN